MLFYYDSLKAFCSVGQGPVEDLEIGLPDPRDRDRDRLSIDSTEFTLGSTDILPGGWDAIGKLFDGVINDSALQEFLGFDIELITQDHLHGRPNLAVLRNINEAIKGRNFPILCKVLEDPIALRPFKFAKIADIGHLCLYGTHKGDSHPITRQEIVSLHSSQNLNELLKAVYVLYKIGEEKGLQFLEQEEQSKNDGELWLNRLYEFTKSLHTGTAVTEL